MCVSYQRVFEVFVVQNILNNNTPPLAPLLANINFMLTRRLVDVV